MAEIKQAKFIDQTGQEKDAVFIGAEKAIYDDSGKRLDQKLEEREKATGLLASDTQGILGSIGTEVSLQIIIDKLAEKIMRELVSNSSLTQTLANYMTTAMMSGEQINDGNKVPTSALAFAMNQAITQNKNAITQLNSELKNSLLKTFSVAPETPGFFNDYGYVLSSYGNKYGQQFDADCYYLAVSSSEGNIYVGLQLNRNPTITWFKITPTKV